MSEKRHISLNKEKKKGGVESSQKIDIHGI